MIVAVLTRVWLTDPVGRGKRAYTSWRDSNQSGNDTTAETNSAPLPLQTVIQETPGKATNTSSNVCDDAGHDGTQVGPEGTAAVEAEPAEPQEHCAENDVRDVVRSVWQPVVFAVPRASSKHQGVGERRGARGDVDGRTTGKVETSELVGPSVGVPGPVGNRVVDDCRPDKHKDNGGEHSAAISCGTDSEGRTVSVRLCQHFRFPKAFLLRNTRSDIRDGSEHALEQAEQQVRDLCASHTGLAQHIHETKVGQITDKGATSMTEGQAVTPEKPLESHHCYTH